MMASSSHPLEEWAQSLTGRDWEIYWSDDGKCQDQQEIDQGQEQKNPAAVEQSTATGDDSTIHSTRDYSATTIGTIQPASVAEEVEEEEEDEEEDPEDWYDGRVEAIANVSPGGKYSFHVRFVGDEQLYTMILEPQNVRPSARAWIARSKALLSVPTLQLAAPPNAEGPIDLRKWESMLPPDTSTIDDTGHLSQLQAQHVNGDVSWSTPTEENPSSDTCNTQQQQQQQQQQQADNLRLHNPPTSCEIQDVRRLSTVLKSQQYLRSRLAPKTELDDGLSYVHADHLMECLKFLDEACQWYLVCWDLHKAIFSARAPSMEKATANTPKVAEEYAIQAGLQEGRRVITNLLWIDASVAGSKKKRHAEKSPSGVRKTKRRRKSKSLADYIKESERGAQPPNPAEDDFLSSNAVCTFVEQLKSSDTRWYMGYFGKMLQSLSLNIVAPYLVWKHDVEIILGDRPESDGECYHSDGATSDEDSDGEGEQSESIISEQSAKGKRYYSFDEIQAYDLATKTNTVLRTLELSTWQDRLRQKLSVIEKFEDSCWSLIAQLYSKPDNVACDKEQDKIYVSLEQLRSAANSGRGEVHNINPLGRSSSVLTRKVLEDAVTIRVWYLDLLRVESSKERLVFIDKMATRASELPRLPQSDYSKTLDELFNEAVARLRKISQGYFDHLTKFNKYRSILLSRSIPDDDEVDGINFMISDGVVRSLRELGGIQVLSIAEEMLSVRLDILQWISKARDLLLAKESIPFKEMAELKEAVDAILDGRSETRTKMIASIGPTNKVNSEVRMFAGNDVAALCGSLVSLINSKYTITCNWKERATSIIAAIKQHNGQNSTTQKPPPMVDFKRIEGLLAEYKNLGIFLPEDRRFLEDVHAAASKWSMELNDSLLDNTKSLQELLACLQNSKVNRPKGIIVDPARHVVDLSVELLLWHNQISEAKNAVCSRTDRPFSDVSKSLYPLIVEGSEILEQFGIKSVATTFSINHVVALDLMFKGLDSRRPMKVLPWAKLQASTISQALLNRIMREDEELGSPLLLMAHILWQASVSDLTQKYENKKGAKNAITLETAVELLRKKPIGEGAETLGLHATEYETIMSALVSEGEKVEAEALRLLSVSKELFRGPSKHPDAIHKHLINLKGILAAFKVPLGTKGSGLVLKKNLEHQVDHHVKVVGWLVRTLPYPFLHQVHFELDPENRMPWDILLNLHERKPGELEKMGDCAGIALRLADVFEAANAWQQEVSKVTLLSNRGGKRRGDGEGDCGGLQIVNVEEVHRLAEDPVLKKVAMPRESAVTRILESAKTFETHLYKFLGQDYDGLNPDLAPYPDTNSLIGKSGEFLLYRLTGSPLYEKLLLDIEQISEVADNVLADTPGKTAFEWIRQAVAWIESLRESITRRACSGDYHRLVISESNARSILDTGRSFFLDIPDDLRKTLSMHRIYIRAPKSAGDKLKVFVKKRGAHHSVGGTAVRWCPFLFDSLKEDILRLEVWKEQLAKVEAAFAEKCLETETAMNVDGKNDADCDKALLGVHQLLEEVTILVEEAVEFLVVAPPKEAFETLMNFQSHLVDQIQKYFGSHSYEQIVTRRFENSQEVLTDRYDLLDSLLSRCGLEEEDLDDFGDIAVDDSDNIYFRNKCRGDLDKGLQKSLHLVELAPVDAHSPAFTLCSTIAWEIELELFTRYQFNEDTTVMSPDYEEKLCRVRCLFEDCSNPELCIKILLGEVEASELVCMTEDELLGEAETDCVQEEGNERTDSPEKPAGHHERSGMITEEELLSDHGSKVERHPAESNCPAEASRASYIVSKEESENVIPLKEVAPHLAANSVTTTTTAPVEESPQSPGVSPLRSSPPPSEVPSALAPTLRPDAPPSLAASLGKLGFSKKVSSKSSQPKASRRTGKYLVNSEGAESFFIAVSKPLLRFKARFNLEDEKHTRIHHILPENMNEKGRLRLEEFSKFLAGKLKGGRWVALSIRMSVSSDEDAKKLKKYYKEYEPTKRIAMFAISEHAKMFLVTPKFHKTAEKILGVSFSAEKSTYAIVLTSKDMC